MPHTKNILRLLLLFVVSMVSLSVCANTLILNDLDNDQLCDEGNCFFPRKIITSDDIVIKNRIYWNSNKNLILHTKGHIIFKKKGKIINKKNGSIILKSGMEPGKKAEYDGTVIFEGDSTQIEALGSGKVKIYYNPSRGNEEHKYHNPSNYFYSQHIKTKKNSVNLVAYMLINDALDLQQIKAFLHGNYALSQNVDASETKKWFKGKGFVPLKDKDKENMPFSGNFDGNNYYIKDLFINRPDEEEVGLFGGCHGRNISRNVIENLILKNFNITGNYYVGSLAGSAINSNLINIKIINPKIRATNIAGGLVGSAFKVYTNSVQIYDIDVEVKNGQNKGAVAGGAGKSDINLIFATEHMKDMGLKNHKQFLGNQDNQTSVCLEDRIKLHQKTCLNFVDCDSSDFMVTNSSALHIPVKAGTSLFDIQEYIKHSMIIPVIYNENLDSLNDEL